MKTIESNKAVEGKAEVKTIDGITLKAIMEGHKQAVLDAVKQYGVEVVKQAIEAYKASMEAEALKAREEEEAVASLLAMVQQPTATPTDLATHVLATWGEKPSQGEFLTSVLLALGMDIDKAKSTPTAILSILVSEAVAGAYPDGPPASVMGHKTTWKADKSTRTRVAAHISKPPQYYVEGRG